MPLVFVRRDGVACLVLQLAHAFPYKLDADGQAEPMQGVARVTVQSMHKGTRFANVDPVLAEDLWLLRYGYVPQNAIDLLNDDDSMLLLASLADAHRLIVGYDLNTHAPFATLKGNE